jgi:hypothetical protein
MQCSGCRQLNPVEYLYQHRLVSHMMEHFCICWHSQYVMTADTEKEQGSAPKNTHCLISNNRVSVSTRNSLEIFHKTIVTTSERPLSYTIGAVQWSEWSEVNHSVIGKSPRALVGYLKSYLRAGSLSVIRMKWSQFLVTRPRARKKLVADHRRGYVIICIKHD